MTDDELIDAIRLALRDAKPEDIARLADIHYQHVTAENKRTTP